METRELKVEGIAPAGKMLRSQLVTKITKVLEACDIVTDSDARLLIQATCLDMVTELEDLIRAYGLDDCQKVN